MFGKPFRETPKPSTPEIPDLKLPENLVLDQNLPQGEAIRDRRKATSLTSEGSERLTTKGRETVNLSQIEEELKTPELINNAEKISRIVAPYFIAIVGLSLYKDNFFMGTILIAIGMLSLLKVSAKDVAAFLEWLKDFLGFSDDDK